MSADHSPEVAAQTVGDRDADEQHARRLRLLALVDELEARAVAMRAERLRRGEPFSRRI
ncbi:hypothetical protein [Cellulomonas hominis]|uniref:hypothetical protein n=1 Tax=Cellulomonas hominis TaxID=156981 RepID=UPI001B9D55E5|nr:hypothetical protein [Cellulomonas hominis]VTR75730.1 hypothetical protein CHMI_00482 [Cellulomonas hominis]